ncbi:RecB family exonuclease [Caldalkalibacillus thermarum]|uniref:RecB family exonuclease n=1 Tax=Caldalkalibacillus thermarum TaxID=296745 RepID=UPI001FD0D797|nr:PD-(D/E)XK nuclease family protein [Caldalkalibacillus thermarum]
MGLIFSFSRLSLYEQCPYRFYLKYIEEREEPVTKPLALGKAVHKAIEKIIAGDSFEEAVTAGIIEVDFHPEVEREEIEKLVQKAPVQPDMGKTEVHFELPLAPFPSAPRIQGYIDLIVDGENETAFVDWKTNWKTYDVFATMQMPLYAWAISEMRGLEEVEGNLYFLRFGQKCGHTFTIEEMENARQWALEQAREIEDHLFLLELESEKVDRIFPAKPSSACQHCPFVMECYSRFARLA